jgi:hypothetical protein
MYQKTNRKFVLCKHPDERRKHSPWGWDIWFKTRHPTLWRLEYGQWFRCEGRYHVIGASYHRRFRYIVAMRQEETIRADEDARYHKVPYKSYHGLPNVWNDHMRSSDHEYKSWKRNTKCRKQWQKNL